MIAIINVPTLVEVSSKNVRVLINRSILNNCFFAFADLANLIKPAIQKINLQMKRPARHVIIKIT